MKKTSQDSSLNEEEGNKEKSISRRDFLKAGTAAAALVAVTATGCTQAATPTPSPTPKTGQAATPTPSAPAEAYMFFNQSEAATVKAIFAQLIPGTTQDPGAVQAGAHIYADHALAGAYLSAQSSYRRGLAAVNAYSQSKNKQDFVKLTSDQQIAVLTDMQNGTATGFYGPSATAFLTMLNQHAREGTFSDPLYGGNIGLVGWKMIGFPGAQVAYGDADMAPGADQTRKTPLTLADEEAIPMPMPQSGY
jgi:gluconate 2-dehydrogenase gamma chain